MARRSIVCVVFLLLMLAAPTAAQGASAAMRTAVVPEAGITLSYPAGWVNVPYDAYDFKSLLAYARSQDPHVTRRQVREWFDAAKSLDASFFAMERRSGDNVLVTVREDDFDAAFDASTSVDQLEVEVVLAGGPGLRQVVLTRNSLDSCAPGAPGRSSPSNGVGSAGNY